MTEPIRWVNPKYTELVAYVNDLRAQREKESSMANCSNCGGTGRIIYQDSDGKMKDISCPGCGGSGQTPEQ